MVFPVHEKKRLSEFIKRRLELSSAFSSTIESRKIFPRALFFSFHVPLKKGGIDLRSCSIIATVFYAA